ncbi:MAG: restriction endonuclease subunit S [Spirochaetes bacterium]|nr:restriction endonuclease subunit S [Spirochaetota bacterium]MBN2772180.1 restriction endonuclease subunit S [Spirochaetota bacterium]
MMSKWLKTKLDNVLTLQRGFDITKKEQKEGSIPIVSSSGISSYHNEYKVNGPGVITGRKGTLGKVHYVEGNYWPHDTTLWVKDFKGNHSRFIYYYLLLMKLETYDVGASNPTLNRNHLHKLDILWPPLPIQKKIAAILSAYDELIENNNRRIAILEKMAEEIYKEWFVRLRFPGHEKVKIVKGVPEGWEVKSIGEIVDFLSGFSFKSDSYLSDAKYGIVTIKNVQDGFFVNKCSDYIDDYPSNMKSHCKLNTGDVLMSLTGNVGRVCHVIGDNFLLNQRVAKLEGKFNYSSQFIYYTFRNKSMVQLIENLSLGSTAQMNLSPIQLGKQKIVIPEQDILKKFEKLISPLSNEKIFLLNCCETLKKSRDLLLPRLISGKLDVEDLDIAFPPAMVDE